MMGGGSGQEASVLEGLIAFGKDPKAMAGRLEQLKAAQDAADERLAKAAEVEAVNAKRTDELASLASDLDQRKNHLDGRWAEADVVIVNINQRQAALDEREATITAAQTAVASERQQAKASLARERASIANERADIDKRAVALDQREAGLDDREAALTATSEKLDAREADFIARQEAVRQALASVREP